VASAGCIDELFATPRFVDMADNYVIDPHAIERAITSKTKAIVPVHFTGEPCDMDVIMYVANKFGIPVVEDACQALMAEYRGKCVGGFGIAGAISLHPLKVLNGTGDGGVIVTNDTDFYERCKRYRNHGLVGRNNISEFGCNSRLDSLQAVFLNYLIKETPHCLERRRANAAYYDRDLRLIDGVHIIERRAHAKSCFHLYFIEVDESIRDQLVKFLDDSGIEARVHYPIPLQGVLEHCGYKRQDFPMAYRQSDRIVTLPVHEALTTEQLDFTVSKIREFMCSTPPRNY
jgi:dTDP-4-amino-4,6-dideoxygalactose transaminase